MSTINSLLSLIAPHQCLGCSQEGSLLCSPCLRGLVISTDRCYSCQRPAPDGLTCTGCYKRSYVFQVQAAASYTGLAKELVRKLKFSGAQAAVRPMAVCMAQLILAASRTNSVTRQPLAVVVVPVPTASSRQRRRGYDQANLLARALARHQNLDYLPCLRRLGQAHQVGAGRAQRLAQLAGAFVVVRPERIRGKHVVLVDDVITTGATFEAAARVLRQAGAARVSAIAFARAELAPVPSNLGVSSIKDNYRL
jgi:ComF family protein